MVILRKPQNSIGFRPLYYRTPSSRTLSCRMAELRAFLDVGLRDTADILGFGVQGFRIGVKGLGLIGDRTAVTKRTRMSPHVRVAIVFWEEMLGASMLN